MPTAQNVVTHITTLHPGRAIQRARIVSIVPGILAPPPRVAMHLV